MTGKRIDLFKIIDEWFIPITFIELLLFANIALVIVLLQAFRVI